MPPRRSICATAVLLLGATPGEGYAQRLAPADARLATEFIFIGSVRELSDGRVLISDPRERRVVVADMATGNIAQVGRAGRGPREYTSASSLRRLAGDSTLLIDGSRRWVFFHGSRVVHTLPPDAPVARAAGGFELDVDTLGSVLVRIPRVVRRPAGDVRESDSIAVVHFRRVGTVRVDTIAYLREAPRRLRTSREGGAMITRNTRVPFAVSEQALLFPDGWTAIARLDPYRIDWRTPEGRILKGAPLPVTLEDLRPEDRRAVIDSYPPRPDGRPSPIDLDAFPAKVPPFQREALLAAPDGRLLVRRTATASRPEGRYDIVDRAGRLAGHVVLSPNERIIGFGRRSVYVVSRDADGLERLRRHPWP